MQKDLIPPLQGPTACTPDVSLVQASTERLSSHCCRSLGFQQSLGKPVNYFHRSGLKTDIPTTLTLALRLRNSLPRQHSQLAFVEVQLIANPRRRLAKVLMPRGRLLQCHILPVQRDVQSCFAPDVVVSAEAFVAAECSRAEEGRGGVCVGVEGGQVLAAVRFIRCGARASARRRWGHQGGCRSTYDGAGVG